ncbi:MAG: YhcH/YjgK/YiaL family protein [Burkholderiales bacterium]
MALFGPFHIVRAQNASKARFAAAFGYVEEMLRPGSLERRRLAGLAASASQRIELAGGAFAIEAAYFTKPRAEGFFESHRKYIDVQVIVEGEELMEVEDIAQLVVAEAYDAERDFIKYAATPAASVLRMRAGDGAIFHPADGHMPSLQWRGPVLVRKTVVKVPAG